MSSLAHRIALALALGAAPALAQSLQLNDPLATDPAGTVVSFRLASGGARAVFLANLGTGSAELYSAPMDGSAAPVELGTSLLSGNVRDYETAGDTVVVLNHQLDLSFRLYGLPATGGTPMLLSAASDVDETVAFRLDPPGTRVLYRTNDWLELWSAPLDGSSAPARLNATGATGEVLEDYAFSPDGAWVVYRQRRDPGGEIDLYSAPADGHAPAERLDLVRPLASVLDFRIAFDSLGVVYRSDQDTPDVVELYAVVIDGSSAPVKRNGPLASGADVLAFELAASSGRVVYRAGPSPRIELFSVSAILGGTPVLLSPQGSPFVSVSGAHVSADGTRVVYTADEYGNGALRLFGVPADGSAAAVRLSDDGQVVAFGQESVRIVEGTGRVLYVTTAGELHGAPLDGSQPDVRLHEPLRTGVEVQLHGTLPDGSVLYVSGPHAHGLDELFRVPLDGSTPPVSLTPDLVSWSHVSVIVGHVASTPDGSRVAYLVRGPANELFSVAALGGPPARLSGRLPAGTSPLFGVSQLQLGPSGRAAYLAAEGRSFGPDLHAVAADGSERSFTLNPALGRFGGGIGPFAFSPDGAHVVYLLGNFGTELHSARAELPGSDVRLDRDPTVGDPAVLGFACTPDSAAVVYSVWKPTPELGIELAPIDGSSPPIELANLPPVSLTPLLSPDGAWILLRSATGVGDLISLPLDGHQPPVMLDSSGYRPVITSDSTRVVYLKGLSGELYSVPIDGGSFPTRLDDHTPVSSFQVSPDGTRVVFFPGLHSVPVDGSQAPVLLAGPAGTATDHYQIEPSSSRVVYGAQGVNGIELLSAPIDGSAPSLSLSGSLPPGENVAYFAGAPFRISTAGRILFRVTDVVSRQGLGSVPIDGSAAPIQVSTAAPVFIELSADQGLAFYLRGDELFRVPVDGSASPRGIGGPGVVSFQVCADGRHVLVVDDQGDLRSILLQRTRRR